MERKEVFFENEFVQYTYDHHQKLFVVIWKNSSNISDELFKQVILKQKYGISHFQPGKMLIDSTNLEYTIDPELQVWFDQQIFPTLINSGVKKVAIVVSKDIITQVSVEQTMEEGIGIQMITRHFDRFKDAQHWLKVKDIG